MISKTGPVSPHTRPETVDEPRRTVIPVPRRDPSFAGWGIRL